MAKQQMYLELTDEKDGVTGTCQHVNAFFPGTVFGAAGFTRNIPFMVDCGSFQGLDNVDQLNTTFNFDVSSLDFSILTHAHLDHYGRYPLAVKQGFHAPIFTTYPTKTFLSEVFLEDCLSIEKRRSKKLGTEPNYEENEIKEFKRYMIPCDFNQVIQYNDNIKIYFFSNGHVPGAAITLVQISYPEQEPINLIFTGDYSNKNAFFPVKPLPDWVFELPNVTIIIESTYGNTKFSDLREDCLIENIVLSLKQKKTCIIPAFAFGRLQEVLYKLKEAQDMGKLNPKYPIYVDGKTAIGCTGLFATGAFKMYPSAKNFLPQNLTFVQDKNLRRFLITDPTSKVIVASSGSGSYGASQSYINGYCSNPDAMIHATGHIFPDSKIGRLKEDENCAALFFDTDEFSAHAKQEVLLEFPRHFNHLRSIGVHHGEESSKETLANLYTENYGVNVHVISSNSVYRITSNGIVLTYPRKSDTNSQIR